MIEEKKLSYFSEIFIKMWFLFSGSKQQEKELQRDNVLFILYLTFFLLLQMIYNKKKVDLSHYFSWCIKKVDLDRYVSHGAYKKLVSNVAHQIKKK